MRTFFITTIFFFFLYFGFTSNQIVYNQDHQVLSRETKIIKANIFTIHYSEALEQPIKVEYRVNCTQTLFSRKGLDFFTCDSIKTSDDLDYRDNVWDKGHMAPAASFACNQEELKATFSYLNCALQHENLNRGVWKNLEIHERELAKSNNVKIKIDIHFSKRSVRLQTGATIPDAFTKTVIYNNKKEVYYFLNSKPQHNDFKKYQIQ
jgi:endonuclease G